MAGSWSSDLTSSKRYSGHTPTYSTPPSRRPTTVIKPTRPLQVYEVAIRVSLAIMARREK